MAVDQGLRRRYFLTPLAKADIFEIWRRIALDSEEAADRVEQAIYDACSLVGQSPLRGHLRPDHTNRNARFWTLTRYPSYLIVYRPDRNPVEIVAIVHGMRNVRRLLRGRV